MEKPKRIGQLDGVRTLAIGAVFLHHAFRVKMMWAGVDLFFILSGFLITGILIGSKQKSLGGYFGHFYGRRARRILPPYLLMLAVMTCFFGHQWMHQWYLYAFLMNFIIAHQLPHPVPAEVLWSLAVEEQFYLVWPFVVYFLSETAIAWMAGAVIVAAPMLRWIYSPFYGAHWRIYSLTPFRMDLLGMGALLAVLWKWDRKKIEKYGVYGPIASAAAVGLLVWLSRTLPRFATIDNTQEGNVWIYELSLVACTGIILWALSGRGVGVLNWAPVRYLGRISYSIYLIHLLVIVLMKERLHSEVEIGGVAALVSVAYAALSWRFFEKPILFWKPRSKVRVEAEEDEKAITARQG